MDLKTISRFILAAAFGAGLGISAASHAADITSSYSTPNQSAQGKLPGVVMLCPSTDGSYSATACSSTAGSGSSSSVTAFSNSSGPLTMGTTAAIVVPYNANRHALWIFNNTAGSETQWLGSANVTVGGGFRLDPSNGFEFNGPGAAGPIYGVTTVPNSAFSFVEG